MGVCVYYRTHGIWINLRIPLRGLLTDGIILVILILSYNHCLSNIQYVNYFCIRVSLMVCCCTT